MDAYGNYTAELVRDNSPAVGHYSPVFSGEGVPDVDVALPDYAVLYIDTLTCTLYTQHAGLWTPVATLEEGYLLDDEGNYITDDEGNRIRITF